MTSALNKLTRPDTVGHAPPAHLPVPLKLDPTHDEGIKQTVKTPRQNLVLFQAVVSTLIDEGHNDKANIVNLAEPLSLPTTDTNVEFMSRPTYKTSATYVKSVMAMHSKVDIFETRAYFNVIHSALVPPS